MTNDIRKIGRYTGKQLFGVAGFVDDLRQQWLDAIEQFQTQRIALDQAESDLYAVQSLAAQNPDDYAEWKSAFSKVNAAKSAMDAVANVVTTISDWWKSATDFFGLSGMKSSGLAGSLGALVPVFPITIGALLSLIAGATAALTAAYAFIRYINAKTDRFSQLVNAGVDPVEANRQATATAQAEAGYSFGARLERVMMFVTIAVAAVFLLPELMRK